MLQYVPDFLQLRIFKKMQPVPFVRTYRSAKFIKEMLEKKADSIHIAMHKTFKLVETTCAETHVDRSRLVETVSRIAEDFSTLNLPCNSYLHKLYHVKKNNLKRNFERLFKRMGLYFFHFDEFHVDDYLYDGIDTEDGFLAVLGILKFDKFTTTTCFHISTYQEAIEGKTTKLRCSGHNMEGDDEDDLKSFDEIEWSDTPVETITYLIDNIADHVPNIKFPFCDFERDQFLAVFTYFANIVERSLHSNKRGISINLDGQAFCSDTIEELASRFPTPAKRQMLGHSITLIYTNEYGTDSYVSLILIPQFADPEMVPMSFQLNFSSNPIDYCCLYAAAIKIKAEGDQRGRDDTGLNAVALFCLPLDWNSPNTDNEILSGEGAYGGWQAVKFCPRGQVIIGFQLRSETDQRGRDDVAADNFLAYCGSPFRPVRDLHNYIQGDTEGWGDWTAEQWCPDGFAVCGINSQIEGPQGGGDDTSLNNVDLKCCEVPKVSSSCKPDYKLVNVDWFDNSRGQRDMVHEYTERTSITRTTGTTTTIENSERKAVAEKISTELGMGGSELAFKVAHELSMSHERSTTESLQIMVQNTVQHETEKKIVITVPAGKRGTLKQLHFTCGDYDIAVALTINRTD